MAQRSDAEVYALVQATRDAVDRQLSQPALSAKPANIGRYDIVFSARAMADILGATLVPATELDRTLGYEANASGTSYLGPDPMTKLGTPIASPVVTVTAERSTPHAVATVKWDDEGVVPEPFTLVKDGILVDYQTTREQAAWLTPWYHKQGHAVRSHGCAITPSAGMVTTQHTPNIVLQPDAGTADEESLISELEHGLFVPNINVDMDFQCSDGIGHIGTAIEIRNGRRIAAVSFPNNGLGLLFRATDFWKNVQAVSGAKSVEWFDGRQTRKGNPSQSTPYSIATVPALVKQQAIVNLQRKV
jgi:TldD protein